MTFFRSFSETDCNTTLEQWDKLLKLELKLEEVGNKTIKKSLDVGIWPTLSLTRKQCLHLPAKVPWKKASQTYVSTESVLNQIQDDLDNGVRNFFFEKDFLSSEVLEKIISKIEAFVRPEEIEIFLLGHKEISVPPSKLKIIDENSMAIGRTGHDHGGTNTQELGLMAFCLIKKLEKPGDKIYVGVFTDSQFFRNIAKLRAAKLIATKILQEANVSKEVIIVGLTSMREWTLYERYSNMLRNDAAVASSYIGGADHVQSAGYQSLFELEGLPSDQEQLERSYRMARNTSHILALESMLGMVEDAAFGSYHLESLTHSYAESAWAFMQKILPLSPVQPFIKETCKEVSEERLKELKTRKHVLAGLNDFPDVKERLNLGKVPTPRFFRTAREFENLRLQMENVDKRPEVKVALFGDYAALNARLNFVKNYFELLGLTVHDPHHSQTDLAAWSKDLQNCQEEIVVLCALDADYPLLIKEAQSVNSRFKYIAGKFEIEGFQNLYAGQNVFDVLNALVLSWGKK